MLPWNTSAVLTILAGLLGGMGSHGASAAGTATLVNVVGGRTPFLAYVNVDFSDAALSSASFTVVPAPGSKTRPVHATFSAAYLASVGELQGNALNIPVFGLYAGISNYIDFTLNFSNGTSYSGQTIFRTRGYVDPCNQVNAPVFHQYRTSTSDLQFDYFLLKDQCSLHSPAIIDTDGNLRWVGTALVGTPASIFTNNAIYSSDGLTGINRILLTTGAIQHIADYSTSYGVTSTNAHNIDFGRNGNMIIDVDANGDFEAEALELDINGVGHNTWDMSGIISAAMTAGGDNPSDFVSPGNDWFHMNSVVYNAADNTLIISSRENFIIAIGYDAPANGEPDQIHWILGDPTKKWYQFPSLRKYALNLGGQVPPIGQHAVSIDHTGSLLFLDNGYPSLFEAPIGSALNATYALAYSLNLNAMTANLDWYYAPPGIYNPLCGSIYDVGGTRLVNFADQGPLAGPHLSHLQGLSINNTVVFDLAYPASSLNCSPAWNARPVDLTNLTF